MIEAACGSALRAGILRAEGALNDGDTSVVTKNILSHTHSQVADTYPEPSASFLGKNVLLSPTGR